jgi:hypothetical protein
VLLALSATAIVVVVLLWEVTAPRVAEQISRHRARRRIVEVEGWDPGRERRAEQKARALLRSCVCEDDWAMYRDLGFLRVWGGGEGPPHAYLVYPHRPIVSFVPQTGRLLAEHCVEFPDESRPFGSTRLPDSDDVLAKWMGLTGDEEGLIAAANMHLPGRAVDPRQVRRDLWRLAQWEQRRMGQDRRRGAGSLPA